LGFYIDAEAVGFCRRGLARTGGGAAIALRFFTAAFFGMLLGLVGLMFGTGLRLAQSLASPDMEDI
jgi:hypothetical protein